MERHSSPLPGNLHGLLIALERNVGTDVLDRAKENFRSDDALDWCEQIGVKEELEHGRKFGSHDVQPPSQFAPDPIVLRLDLFVDPGQPCGEGLVLT